MNRGGQLLLDWLARTGRSQASLAQQLGVAQRTVSRWIGGIVPQVDDASRLEVEAGVPVRAWAEPARVERAATGTSG